MHFNQFKCVHLKFHGSANTQMRCTAFTTDGFYKLRLSACVHKATFKWISSPKSGSKEEKNHRSCVEKCFWPFKIERDGGGGCERRGKNAFNPFENYSIFIEHLQTLCCKNVITWKNASSLNARRNGFCDPGGSTTMQTPEWMILNQLKRRKMHSTIRERIDKEREGFFSKERARHWKRGKERGREREKRNGGRKERRKANSRRCLQIRTMWIRCQCVAINHFIIAFHSINGIITNGKCARTMCARYTP